MFNASRSHPATRKNCDGNGKQLHNGPCVCLLRAARDSSLAWLTWRVDYQALVGERQVKPFCQRVRLEFALETAVSLPNTEMRFVVATIVAPIDGKRGRDGGRKCIRNRLCPYTPLIMGACIATLNIEVLRADEASMERRRNVKAGEAGDPREDPPTSGIFRHDSHLRKSGVARPGIEPISPW
ncbi:hypothetical protein PR048_007924 [Dryococelus australis]|uniref:Uncharacterized protein n=1 Tax=Dryococelus australis TaxID=614101 RepID=A0ABQ9HVM4_9NEOP|nr:hypothetical protein PR048_007924 [Dryococelus australis]